MNIFIEGSLISAEVLFCLRALLVKTGFLLIPGWPLQLGWGGVTYTRQEVGTFSTTVPQDENLRTYAPSGLEPPMYNKLGYQH